MIRKGASHHRSGTNDHVLPERRSREDDHPGADPTTAADDHRNVVGPLGVHDLIGILIAVVLVGYVDVRARVDVITDVHLEVTDDVAPSSDHAAVADPHDGIGDHVLARYHAGRDADVGSDQRVPSQVDPAFTEDRTRWEGEAATGAESPEAGCQAIVRPGGAVPGRPLPACMDERVEPPSAVSRRGCGRIVGARPAIGHFPTLSDALSSGRSS
jgi:hypothetical protein